MSTNEQFQPQMLLATRLQKQHQRLNFFDHNLRKTETQRLLKQHMHPNTRELQPEGLEFHTILT
jgi:hypothetical protein